MTNEELLVRVKNAVPVTGTYHDSALTERIIEVKKFLLDGGVPIEVIESEEAAGLVTRGTLDLWNYGAGGGSLSEYFIQRVTQLRYKR